MHKTLLHFWYVESRGYVESEQVSLNYPFLQFASLTILLSVQVWNSGDGDSESFIHSMRNTLFLYFPSLHAKQI